MTGGPSAARLVFRAPAQEWLEAIPIGNGRTGAMVFGGYGRSRVQINDATAWSGCPEGPDDALDALIAQGAGPGPLAAARAAMKAGQIARAEEILTIFQAPHTQAFQPFVDLQVAVHASDPAASGASPEGYSRWLDLRDGVAGESYRVAGCDIRTTALASFPAGVVSLSWEADGGRLDVALRLQTVHPRTDAGRPHGADAQALAGEIVFRLPDDVTPTHETAAVAVRYDGDASRALHGVALLQVATDGAVVRGPDAVDVTGASWVHACVATGTTSRWPDPGPLLSVAACRAAVAARIAHAVHTDAGSRGALLRQDHVREHRSMVDRVGLRIGRAAQVVELPSALDDRQVLDDGSFAAVIFQYGRYLLMASSRPGSPPANLQGIWNDDVRPPWSANYTINVNTQMNYWAAEAVALPECHEPLLEHIEVVARHGARVARELYGCGGWLAHHNTDVWGRALSVGAGQGAACWADWWLGGVWISRHLWDHFEFCGDLTFLRERAWPLLRGAAAFCLDWLVEDEAGTLHTLPSTSPENTYLTPGGAAALTRSSAMDLTLIADLFDTCARTGDLLGLADPVVDRARAARPRLAGLHLGARGQVCEWDADPHEVDPHHRHLSPLVGLHPLDLIDLDRTPELAAAARRTLELRGPGSTGWSLAWKLTMQARLGSGDAAADLLAQSLVPASRGAGLAHAGGLHPNLFATHPPFQIDGNFGLMGGIAEMLVQSQAGVVRVLPALPSSWPEGEVSGLRLRGGASIDVRWAAGRLLRAEIHAERRFARPVTYAGVTRDVVLDPGQCVVLDGW